MMMMIIIIIMMMMMMMMMLMMMLMLMFRWGSLKRFLRPGRLKIPIVLPKVISSYSRAMIPMVSDGQDGILQDDSPLSAITQAPLPCWVVVGSSGVSFGYISAQFILFTANMNPIRPMGKAQCVTLGISSAPLVMSRL